MDTADKLQAERERLVKEVEARVEAERKQTEFETRMRDMQMDMERSQQELQVRAPGRVVSGREWAASERLMVRHPKLSAE